MPTATVTHHDEVEPAEGSLMKNEVAALVAAAARLTAAERKGRPKGTQLFSSAMPANRKYARLDSSQRPWD